MFAAAYGAVPIDRAPRQTSRDGEDYALFMAGTLTEDPARLYFDCSGTIATAVGGPAKATAAKQPAAHLWGHIFGRFDSGELAECLHKTKGHATRRDAEEGVSSHWERRANAEADRLAKQGARLHGLTDQAISEVAAIVAFQARVGRYLGSLAAWLEDNGLRDHDELGPKAAGRAELRVKAVKLSDQLAGLTDHGFDWAERHTAAAALQAQAVGGHTLMAASRRAPHRGALLMCTARGAHTERQVYNLCLPCPGRRRASKGGAHRASRF